MYIWPRLKKIFWRNLRFFSVVSSVLLCSGWEKVAKRKSLSPTVPWSHHPPTCNLQPLSLLIFFHCNMHLLKLSLVFIYLQMHMELLLRHFIRQHMKSSGFICNFYWLCISKYYLYHQRHRYYTIIYNNRSMYYLYILQIMETVQKFARRFHDGSSGDSRVANGSYWILDEIAKDLSRFGFYVRACSPELCFVLFVFRC